MTDLKGIVVPIVTALDSNRKYDPFSSRKFINYLLGKKVGAIFVLGGVGEGVNFSLSQKRDILSHVIDTVAGRVPILYNVSDVSLDRAVEQYEAVRDLAVDYYVSTLPFYYPLRPDEEATYYVQLADTVDKPLLMYNLPRNVGQHISLETIEMVAAHPNIGGIKETTADIVRHTAIASIKKNRNPRWKCFTGSPTMVYYSMHAGFDGAVLGLSNVAPSLCVKTYEACLSGPDEEAFALQTRMTLEAGIIEKPSTISAVKNGLRRMGYLTTDNMLMPYTSYNLTPEQFALVQKDMEE